MKRRKKPRWKQAATFKAGTPKPPRFRFVRLKIGVIFYRGVNPFTWEALDITNDEAAAFVNRLNSFKGKEIERTVRPITERFIAEYRANHVKK